MATRDTYHHGDLKRALLEATLEIVKEHGADSFTLREAARRVGVNHRAAYRHFADKTALLAAVAEQGYRLLVERMEEEVRHAQTDTRAELFALGRTYVRFAIDHPAHFRVMFGPKLERTDEFAGLAHEARRAFDLVRGTFLRGVSAGSLRDDLGMHGAVSLWSTMHGLASLILMGRVPVKEALLESFTDQVLGPAIDGLCRRPASGPTV